MKKMKDFNMRHRSHRIFFLTTFFGVLILVFASCTGKPEQYSILEFSGTGNVSNYSKSFLLMLNKSDSVNPTPLLAGNGDIIAFDEKIFVYDNTSPQTIFLLENNDSALYINGKLNSFDIPNNNKMIPWIKNLSGTDLSSLQFISFDSEMPDDYLPLLTKLAEMKPDAGLYFEGDFAEMTKLLKIFKPRYIAAPSLVRSDFDMLSKITGLEILMVSLEDSVITDPLPALPSLKQIFLSNIGKDVTLSDNFLANNRQIERLIIQRNGSIDFALLKPLENLKELVVSGVGAIMNLDQVNSHKKIEVLSVTGEELVYDPAMIKLPDLRWMAFSSNVTQEEFSSFINAHPGLEVIEVIKNSKIGDFQPLSKVRMLNGLTVTDTVKDITSIKTLTNLKYLSMPDKFLNDKAMKAELQKSLPGTRISANEGFCLGSGWLFLLIPLVFVLRLFGKSRKQKLTDAGKS